MLKTFCGCAILNGKMTHNSTERQGTFMLLLSETNGLDLRQTLDCGQCFRWVCDTDGSWRGIVANHAVRVQQTDDGTLLLQGLAGESPEADPDFWRQYFALDLDYPALLNTFRAANPKLAQCVEYAPGIRVLRQPFFETLVTFLISQNNNIPRIKGITARLCEGLGEPLVSVAEETDNTLYYTFPTAKRLAALQEEDLAFLRAGWRAGYILDAARKVASGQICEQELRSLPFAEAKAKLMTVRGVGPKVADCTLLYGLGRWEAYPIDVWMKRADEALFTARVKDAAAYLNRRTQGHAGIAQQYIFAWARTHL
jgi:N-glycosylase/DNA lyase